MGGTSDAGDLLFEGFLDGSYDCVDRVVLRAYFQLGQRAAGPGAESVRSPIAGSLGSGARRRH